MKTIQTVFALLLISIFIFLPACSKQEIKPAPAAEAAAVEPEAPTAEAESADEAENTNETEETETAGSALTGNSVLDPKPESALAQLEANVEVTKQQTILGETRENRKFEDKSWFAGLKCERYSGPDQGTFGTGTKKEDKLTFRVTNNDNREYNLTWANAFSRIGADETTNVPMKISVNGNRLVNEEIKACCGTMIIKPGQTLECTNCPANLRYPETHKYLKQNTEVINNLEVRSRFASSQIEFKCRT